MFGIIFTQFDSDKEKKYAFDFVFDSNIEELLKKYVDERGDLCG